MGGKSKQKSNPKRKREAKAAEKEQAKKKKQQKPKSTSKSKLLEILFKMSSFKIYHLKIYEKQVKKLHLLENVPLLLAMKR